jgi:hypothetical protein
MRTLTRRRSAPRRRVVATVAALGVVGLSAVALTSTASVGASTGSIAVFGDNETDNTLRALGYAATVVTDAQIATPGFLNGFDAFYFTRNGSEYGDGLSEAAAAAVRNYVGSDGNIVLLNGDFADPLMLHDAEIIELTGNAAGFAVQSGHGFVGEFNGAVSALTSNSDELVPLGLIAGAAGPLASGPANGTITVAAAGVGHPVLDGVGLPFDPFDVDFGPSMTGIDSALVLARYSNGAPAIIAKGTANDPPAISVPSDMTVEGNAAGGADVTFAVTASDSEDGDLTAQATCTPSSGSFFPLGGPQLVGCSVTDSAGETTSDSFSVTVVDTTPPAVTLAGGPVNGGSYYFGTPLDAPSCTATDVVDGEVGCDLTGYSSMVGQHTVTGSATDRSGNTETAVGPAYSVLPWTLNGFFRPVDVSAGLAVAKGGSTVPLKFEVFAGPTELTSTDVVDTFRVLTIPCDSARASVGVVLTSLDTTLVRYESTAGHFILNWATPKAPGSCVRVVLTLDDGSTAAANFKLK